MPNESVLEFEVEASVEELLDKAEQAARDRGYSFDRHDEENTLVFSDNRSEYRLDVEDGRVKLYGDTEGALGAYKNILESKL
jgi:hypothetical protein